MGCLVVKIHLDTFCALTRSTTSVASGVLLVLGGMSRGAGRTHSDWEGMFLMNLKLNKRIKTVRIKENTKPAGLLPKHKVGELNLRRACLLALHVAN